MDKVQSLMLEIFPCTKILKERNLVFYLWDFYLSVISGRLQVLGVPGIKLTDFTS